MSAWATKRATEFVSGDRFEYYGHVYQVVQMRIDDDGHAIVRALRPDGNEWTVGFGPRSEFRIEPRGFGALVGQTLARVIGGEFGSEKVRLVTTTGRVFIMHHRQDCCENVSLEDVTGDFDDIIGSEILVAEERETDLPQEALGAGWDARGFDDAVLWTFYEIRTVRGSVTMRWFGESNGYYSVSVDFEESPDPYIPEDEDTWIVAGDLAMSRGQADGDEILWPERMRAYFELGGT